MRRWQAVTVLLLVVTACGSSESNASAVQPFDEIAIGEPSIDLDSSGTFATLRVRTSVEAVCAVGFGEDESLGSLATDQDMAGGGHEEHAAVMTGLLPGTVYHYRLQGVGPDGTLYQSDIRAFTTPEPTGSALPEGLNLATSATVVDVSSEFSETFGADKAIDGDLATEWATAGDGDDAYIVIDLEGSFEVSGVVFRTRSMTDGSSITNSFTVTADDGETLGPFPVSDSGLPTELDIVGQVLRFDVDNSTGGNTGAVEIEVYGADAP